MNSFKQHILHLSIHIFYEKTIFKKIRWRRGGVVQGKQLLEVPVGSSRSSSQHWVARRTERAQRTVCWVYHVISTGKGASPSGHISKSSIQKPL